MFYSTILLAASAALSGMASAQSSIDPNSVSASDRGAWCRAEYNTCNTLCGSDISVNNCSTTDLTYDCACTTITPNMSDYEQTVPYYVCVEWKDQCNDNNAGNATAQSSCQAVQCATKTASNIVSTSTSSSSAAASSSGSSGSAAATTGASSTSASGSAASATSTGGATAVGVGREYGAGVLVASLFGLFAYAL